MITILDTTLRDGGYLNNWNFGEKTILKIVENLVLSNVDLIELGFLSNQSTIAGRTIFNSLEETNKYIKKDYIEKCCVMLKSGDFDISRLEKKDENNIEKIRYIFKKKQAKIALKECEKLLNFGYKLSINPVFIDDYSKEEYFELIEKIDNLNPEAICVVDSMGSFSKEEIQNFFLNLNTIIKKDISLSFHCHNNTKRALENVLGILELNLNRNIIIDCTTLGIGRGAGNLQSEIFAQYLNENHNKNYKIEFFNEIIDKHLLNFKNNITLQDSSIYYSCALNRCHSNYALYLIKNKLNLKDGELDKIFKLIPTENKTTYDEKIIEEIVSRKYILR